ncbi:response regulator [Janthinobacterium sp. BJB1]|uniref:response regulator n=1 Tax=Janthinobacterium sp. GW458P TaxID=1981504 RepID=UPI000A32726C|nr:response regulator [Janthinobacterium sp. GW458P]MBE3028159.1 response regulator [Janthinobacterium sp. GW458P]PHV17217.1 response regulator [Janthinobacterium sp. BJB303]PJC96729.1 response regulator [Janthinobacterium sp. BJB1]
MKVLVVDDDVVSRMVLMHLIDSCGVHDIVEAEDGAAAWEQLEGGLRPSLCFCDLRMPRLSGMELLQKIRSDSALDAMPLVLVSSANDHDTVRDAVQAGAAGYIVKPFQPEQVRQHIDACFDVASLPAEAPLATAQRLGIDDERLLAYLTGFQGQIGAAGEQVDALLARGEPAQARQLLERLHLGCRTLGLHGAGGEMAALLQAAVLDSGQMQAALAALARSAAQQARLLRQLDDED